MSFVKCPQNLGDATSISSYDGPNAAEPADGGRISSALCRGRDAELRRPELQRLRRPTGDPGPLLGLVSSSGASCLQRDPGGGWGFGCWLLGHFEHIC